MCGQSVVQAVRLPNRLALHLKHVQQSNKHISDLVCFELWPDRIQASKSGQAVCFGPSLDNRRSLFVAVGAAAGGGEADLYASERHRGTAVPTLQGSPVRGAAG